MPRDSLPITTPQSQRSTPPSEHLSTRRPPRISSWWIFPARTGGLHCTWQPQQATRRRCSACSDAVLTLLGRTTEVEQCFTSRRRGALQHCAGLSLRWKALTLACVMLTA